MEDTSHLAIAVVGVGAIMPDAPHARVFWDNIRNGHYAVSDVRKERWDPELYYDADPKAPDKSYSKIGGWVRDAPWDPMAWKLAIPPRVVDAMDEGQRWALACTREALLDYGWPNRSLDFERTAVIIGNAMAGEKHYRTALRVSLPEYAEWLAEGAAFSELPSATRDKIQWELRQRVGDALPPITEDSMPGELANCIAGRIANVFNFRGPNFTCDAACASALAALSAAREGLIEGDFDAVLTGGIDRNMGAPTFVKFCKIGALSATGTRPFADGADGFVMGEGSALFLLKRLADAEKAGDPIHAVIRGMAGSSDGKGKGITAPNPVGQRLAISRAWKDAGIAPGEGTLVEAHGTSTKVGDVVELSSLAETFGSGFAPRSIALGSVKSNIGHLKGAAGAAGLFKAVMSLRDKVLPPSLNFAKPNPNVDWSSSPFYVNTELCDWKAPADGVRKAAVSAFGFGGTNFHIVLEEHHPGRLTRKPQGRGLGAVGRGARAGGTVDAAPAARVPARGALVVGAADETALLARLEQIKSEVDAGKLPAVAAPARADLESAERVAIDWGDAEELAGKLEKVIKALGSKRPAALRPLRSRGIFRGSGPAPKVAFLFTGQGSQYANMLRSLSQTEPVVRELFEEADRVMTPKLGRPLSSLVFVDPNDERAVRDAEEALKQTEITQPAVLTVDTALARLMKSYGVEPDFVMGHSLGEYGALVAADALPFADALEAVAARGKEMSSISLDDNGKMAAAMGPVAEIERVLASVKGYVVIANFNSTNQVVIGGSSEGVDNACAALKDAGFQVVPLQVSHAFHTSIVAPASEPLRRVLERLALQSPRIPVVANVDGELYPQGDGAVDKMLDILARQVACPVQFVKGLDKLYDCGARVFVELGPKRALHGFAEDVLGSRADVLTLSANHPKLADATAFNHALCGLYARGLGRAAPEESRVEASAAPAGYSMARPVATAVPTVAAAPAPNSAAPASGSSGAAAHYAELGKAFVDLLGKAGMLAGGSAASAVEPVAITGAAIGLPGTPHVFEPDNVARILAGEQLIGTIPAEQRKAMLDKHITRLVKKEGRDPVFETIDSDADVIKLAGRAGAFDLGAEYGVPNDRLGALDITTKLAFAAGIEALRDAGLPLVVRYKTTTKGTFLPDGWALPESLRDDTGIVFACAFPGYDNLMGQLSAYHEDRQRRARLSELESVAQRVPSGDPLGPELWRRISDLRAEIDKTPFEFDRRFLFQVLAMGHSQFAEYIRARGPNTQVNSACASTTQAVTLAQDWIRAGRCRRVIVIAADDITSDNMLGWWASGFLATGAAATDESVAAAATPFDRRRHGMLIGMGAAALVIEAADAAKERGIAPIGEILGSVTANSAFHGTRLDVEHITSVMESLVADVERRWGLSRAEIARQLVFVSHETYTPARGGSAAAEVFALRRVFGAAADQIVIANTKGFTGHPMGAGIEDVIAVKSLETGIVPPVPNFKEVDPELGQLNLSKGGDYPVEYALRLGAGFGSQISMTLVRRGTSGPRPSPRALGFENRILDRGTFERWLAEASGDPTAELEIVSRTLRVKDKGPTPRTVAAAKVQPSAVPAAAVLPARPAPAPLAATPVIAASSAEKAPPVAAKPSVDTIAERVLALVSDKTGYPRDMLAMDLDLEADLGIDTVKQAEVFASIRAAYDIPRDDNLKLRDYPTLGHVIGFVKDKRPDLAAALASSVVESPATAPTAPAVQAGTEAGAGADPIAAAVLALVSEKTGYPQDMLALDLDLEADLGVDTVKQAEVFASIRAAYDIPRDDNLKLRDYPTLGHVIGFVKDKRPDLAATIAASVGSMARSAPAAAPAVEAAARGAGGADPIAAAVLALVADKTGYPEDMLALDLDLEADLGVDTVKQAEVFASIRAQYDIPRDDNLKLRDYPTLGHVIGFVKERRPDLVSASPAAPAAAGGALAAPAAPASASSSETDEITAAVLALVAEKTGYPEDMLALDLDLEADLGVDTVKQAEVFASIRAQYDIPRDDNLKLRDYPTLGHVIGFVKERRPDLGSVGAAGSSAASEAAARASSVAAATSSTDSTSAAYPRRVPVPVVRPALTVCKPTAVTLDGTRRVVVVPDDGGIADVLAGQLAAHGVEVLLPAEPTTTEHLLARVDEWLQAGPVHGVYWLPALDAEPALWDMDDAQFDAAANRRIKQAYALMRALYGSFEAPGSFFVSATRMGGQHGYDAAGALSALAGGVSGITKALGRERPAALVKCVDFERDADARTVASALVDETLRDPGAMEVGHQSGRRFGVGFDIREPGDSSALPLGKDSVFVVTGAAGSITSAITADLAQAAPGTFYLLDLTPAPDPEDPDLGRLATDREGLKRDLFERIKATGERATPARVEQAIAGLERAAAALAAISAVQAAGGTAVYRSLDLRDGEAVARVFEEIRTAAGRVDVLVHAGGLEISRFLPDKQPAEFDRVWDVKAVGLHRMLRAAGNMPIAAVVAFSSIAGRFGNAGQTDYSSANDLLCKTLSSFRNARPATRGIAIDWTAWSGIGMASRGSIPKMMEAAGIDMLPPEVGIPVVRRELSASDGAGEIVVAGSLGMLMAELDETGGVDPEALSGRKLPMLGSLLRVGQYGEVVVEATLDPAEQGFLFDHRIDEVPVLPGVMGLEAFAEVASLLLPGWTVDSIDDVEFLAPFKFYRNEPRTLRVTATLLCEGETVAARCRLDGTRTLPGQGPQTTTHFTAVVRLAQKVPSAEAVRAPAADAAVDVRASDIYRVYFHGPAYRVLERAWRVDGGAAALVAKDLPPNHQPPELPTLMAPRLIESCFQTAGIWEMGTTGRMGLPQHIDRVTTFLPPESANGDRLYVVAKPSARGYEARIIDEKGRVYVLLEGYRTAALPASVESGLLEPLSRAMA